MRLDCVHRRSRIESPTHRARAAADRPRLVEALRARPGAAQPETSRGDRADARAPPPPRARPVLYGFLYLIDPYVQYVLYFPSSDPEAGPRASTNRLRNPKTGARRLSPSGGSVEVLSCRHHLGSPRSPP